MLSRMKIHFAYNLQLLKAAILHLFFYHLFLTFIFKKTPNALYSYVALEMNIYVLKC